MRRHLPSLYAHPEGDSNEGEDENDDPQWPAHSSPRQLSYGTSSLTSSVNKARSRQHSSFVSSPGATALLSPPMSAGPSSKYSDIYSQFVQRYRSRPDTFNDPRDEVESNAFHGASGSSQLFEEESEDDRYKSVKESDEREKHTSLLNNEPLSIEERERLEWQSMLTSVLDGDVLRSEKSRIQVALLTSSDLGTNRHLDIWIALRARLRRRTVQEERRILEERKAHIVDRIISEILQFRVIDSADFPSAANQVNAILQHLDKIQSFYPHLKAFYLDKPVAAQQDFQSRCDALLTWSTVLSSLRQQIFIFKRWTGSDTLDVTARSTRPEHGECSTRLGSHRYSWALY